MKSHTRSLLSMTVASAFALAMPSHSFAADGITKAFSEGKAKVDFRLRYEDVSQDNPLDDASALTLRTRLGYTTGEVSGWSATVEMEDNRIVLGQGDYSVPPAGFKPGEFSVIADPEFTELEQAFVQYKGKGFKAKLGRQVITMDNHRFVGHVGWRQDRQTFDGLTLAYSPSKDVNVSYAYIDQRNRIFGETADLDAKDHLFNASYKTSVGKLTGYGYLLEVDNDTDNAIDTFGVRFSGGTKAADTKIIYTAEYATQSADAGANSFDANYLFLEAGAVFSGITAKVGYEVLGSDDGQYGFSTPLATLHKFNGWADQFLGTPAQGLVDVIVTVAGKAAGGKFTLAYHDYSAETPTIDDLGSEINISYGKKFGKHYNAGIKYANYSAGDIKVDADKLWLWVGATF